MGHGYILITEQCRAKVKSLQTKYKQIVDQLRRSGTGCEPDEESEVPSDFLVFEDIDAMMGGRAFVMPVHLLLSAPDPLTNTPVLALLCLWRAGLAHQILCKH